MLLAMVALVWSLLAACSHPRLDGRPEPEVSSPAVTATRDYWPTGGWRTASAGDKGMDSAALAQVEDQVAAAYPQLSSVLVVRDGYLVYERYWHGLDEMAGHDLRSVTKSVTGALIGIALAEGKIESLEATVGELLPTQLPADADPRLARVTVKQLLTMTSGLAADEDTAGGDSRLTDSMLESPDWVRHILGRRLEYEPGDRFAYSSSSSHLLSAIVSDASGLSTLAFARANLFDPLGIRTRGALEPVVSRDIEPAVLRAYQQARVAWPVDPQGYHVGGTGLRLTARDLAKLGYLYLNGGRWEGEQLIPADYVADATSSTGPGSNLSMGYGWHWWVAVEDGHHTFSARGLGGQYIYVVPDLDLITVVTSDPEVSGADPKILITRTVVPRSHRLTRPGRGRPDGKMN